MLEKFKYMNMPMLNIRFSHDDEMCTDTNILMMKRGARAKNPDVEEKLVEVNIKRIKNLPSLGPARPLLAAVLVPASKQSD